METIAGEAAARPWRRVASLLGVFALFVSALVGGDAFGLRSRLFDRAASPRPAAIGRAMGDAQDNVVPAAVSSVRSQPWWQGVATLRGEGDASAGSAPAPFTIASHALQWRIKWSCERGHLVVRTPSRPRSLVDDRCGGSGTEYSSKPGAFAVSVQTDGPWTLQVDQQVDVPLVEAPLPAMADPAASTLAAGTFAGIDQSAYGRIEVHRLPDGSHALRLIDFFVTPNTDLTLEFSELAEPRSTPAFTAAPAVVVAPLDITAGSMNVVVPGEIDLSRYRSVVVWCERLHSAYAAASLSRR